MQVYKAFFKIIKKNITEIIIYIGVFLFFAVYMGSTDSDPTNRDFEETKVNVAFINNDKDSLIIDGIEEYIKESANIVEVKEDKEGLQDALFFREVEYIITIPKGFTDKLLSGDKDISIDKNTIPNSTSEVYMDNLINRYLNTASIYTSTINDISEKELVSYVKKDLSHDTEVKIFSNSNGYVVNENCKNYYSYLAYAMFSTLILGISTAMNVFNNKDLKMRNLSSSLSIRKMNFQLVLGNITLAKVIWIIMIIPSFILYGDYMFTKNGLLFILNSFIFTIAALSISLLVANIIKGRNAISAASNIVALGSCFLSGVFVPQEFLGDTVISIAKFNPTYWYVKANNEISTLVNYNAENLKPIFMNMLIVLCFSLAILGITLVMMKQKSIKSH